MRRRNCWSRDLGRGSADVGGASPCHNHKPASLISVLTNRAEGDIGGAPVTIGALLYVWRISSPGSACTAHVPLLVAAPVPACVTYDTRGRTQVASVCNRPSRRQWPYRPDDLLTGRIGGRNNHPIEVRRRPRVIFVAERHIGPRATRLEVGKDITKWLPSLLALPRETTPCRPALVAEVRKGGMRTFTSLPTVRASVAR
jgi:hypothetical protein